MASYSTSDLSRKSGDIIAEALRRPVMITQRKKPRLVLLSIEDYGRLTARAETRAVGVFEATRDTVFEDFESTVSEYRKTGEAPSTARPAEADHDRWFRAKVKEALDDSRPGIPHEDVEAYFADRRAAVLRKVAESDA